MMLERESHSQVLGPPSTDRGESLTSHSTSHHHASGHYKLGSSPHRQYLGTVGVRRHQSLSRHSQAEWVLSAESGAG